MIKEKAFNVLVKMEMPASLLGLQYITETMELFDNGYLNTKITVLYDYIGERNGTTGSRVERAMRHAFESVVLKGHNNIVEKYLSFDNTSNANMLKLLYHRLKQEEQNPVNSGSPKVSEVTEINKYSDPYQTLEDDMFRAIQRFVKKLKEGNVNACSKVG
jgi:hypothetical protein